MNQTLSHFMLMRQNICPTKTALQCLSLTTPIKHSCDSSSKKALKGKTTAEKMDVIKKLFLTKSIKLDKIMFSVMDGTNSMSEKNIGFEDK